jgi:hypothetical protein
MSANAVRTSDFIIRTADSSVHTGKHILIIMDNVVHLRCEVG